MKCIFKEFNSIYLILTVQNIVKEEHIPYAILS
jgi:hypothetical protein